MLTIIAIIRYINVVVEVIKDFVKRFDTFQLRSLPALDMR